MPKLSLCAVYAVILSLALVLPAMAEPAPNASGSITPAERELAKILNQILETNCGRKNEPAYCQEKSQLRAMLEQRPGIANTPSAVAPLPRQEPASQPTGMLPVATEQPAETHQDILNKLNETLEISPLTGAIDNINPQKTNESLIANGHGAGVAGEASPPSGTGGAAFSVAAATDSNNATINVAFDTSQIFENVSSFKLIGQTPLSKTTSYTNLGTLDGLAKSSAIGIQYNFVPQRWAVYNEEDGKEKYDSYNDACIEVLKAFAAIDKNVENDKKFSQNITNCSGDILESWIKGDQNLTAADMTALISSLEKIHSSKKILPTIQSLWMFALNAKVGYDSHSYYTPLNLDKEIDDTWPFQLGIAATYLFDQGLMSTTLAYNYQKAYSDGGASGQTEVLCPASTSKVFKCVDGYINRPTLSDNQLISLDLRKYFTSLPLLGTPLALDPTMTYDAHSGAYGFQFPIYLVSSASKALTGGIRYDWTSDKHESIIGIFITSSFCILPGNATCPN